MRETVMTQAEDGTDDIIYEQDHHNLVRGYLNQQFGPTLDRTHDRRRPSAGSLATKIAGLKPCDFLWVYVNDSCYRLYDRICLSWEDKSPLPSQKSIVTCCSRHGRKRIMIDACRVTKGGHTEHL
jgi:hypothetical protein